MKMRAYELMAKAQAEPGKYEGKQYRTTNGSGCVREITGVNKKCEKFEISKSGELCSSSHLVYFTCNTEVEEIQQPVSFMEAVKAFESGKTIRVEWFWIVYTYKFISSGHGLIDNNGQAINVSEITTGKWYIGEEQ